MTDTSGEKGVYFGVNGETGRIVAVCVDLGDASTREAVSEFLEDGLVIERGTVAEARKFTGKQWADLISFRSPAVSPDHAKKDERG